MSGWRQWPARLRGADRTQRLRAAAAALTLLLLAHLAGLLALPGLQRADNLLYDLGVRVTAPTAPDPRILMVDIDERALAAHGRWPWRRAQLAALVDRLGGPGGARVLALDLVMAEPDTSSGLAALDQLAGGPLAGQPAFLGALRALRPSLDDDARLARSLAGAPVLLGFHLSHDRGAARQGVLPPPLLSDAAMGGLALDWPTWRGHGGNLPVLQAAARGAGHLNYEVDDDGVFRRAPLLVRYEGGVYAALAWEMARAWHGLAEPLRWHFSPAEPPLRGVALAGARPALRAPLDAQARVLLPFRSRGAFLQVSAAEVLAGQVPASVWRDRAVLVGVSAPGLVDQRQTPVDATMPGTLVHAHLLSGLLDDRLLASPPEAALAVALALLLCAAVLVIGLPRLPMWQAGGLTLALLAGLLLLQALAWVQGRTVLPMAAALVLPLLLLAVHLLQAYRAATTARHELRQLFGQYVPPELAQAISQAPARQAMRSRSAELSILFADVRGFSGLAEHMPPAELSAMINLLFSRLTDTLRAHHGTLDKYIGDAVMAFWGAPLDDPLHAHRAVAAALAMRASLPALQAELAARGWPALDLSIGIDTGTVVVGDMGSRHRRAYTAMGDAVNRAARLQALASDQGLGLVIGDGTRLALARAQAGPDASVGPAPVCLSLGSVQLRGRDGRTSAWFPLAASPDATQLAGSWARLRQAVGRGDRPAALQQLQVLAARPDCAALCRWQQRQLDEPPAD